MRLLLKRFTVISLIFSGFFYIISPIVNIALLFKALNENDSEKYIKYIDFPLLRSDLKNQFYYYFNKKASNNIKEDQFSDLKMLLISPIIKNIVSSSVETVITPKGLYRLLNTGYISKNINNNTQEDINDIKGKFEYSFYYKNINTFILTTKPANNEKQIISRWKRKYLFNWKLYSIKVPLM